MTRKNVVQRIMDFNAGRDPERLALKYRAMQTDPLVFLRGSCHLSERGGSGARSPPEG